MGVGGVRPGLVLPAGLPRQPARPPAPAPHTRHHASTHRFPGSAAPASATQRRPQRSSSRAPSNPATSTQHSSSPTALPLPPHLPDLVRRGQQHRHGDQVGQHCHHQHICVALQLGDLARAGQLVLHDLGVGACGAEGRRGRKAGAWLRRGRKAAAGRGWRAGGRWLGGPGRRCADPPAHQPTAAAPSPTQTGAAKPAPPGTPLASHSMHPLEQQQPPAPADHSNHHSHHTPPFHQPSSPTQPHTAPPVNTTTPMTHSVLRSMEPLSSKLAESRGSTSACAPRCASMATPTPAARWWGWRSRGGGVRGAGRQARAPSAATLPAAPSGIRPGPQNQPATDGPSTRSPPTQPPGMPTTQHTSAPHLRAVCRLQPYAHTTLPPCRQRWCEGPWLRPQLVQDAITQSPHSHQRPAKLLATAHPPTRHARLAGRARKGAQPRAGLLAANPTTSHTHTPHPATHRACSTC